MSEQKRRGRSVPVPAAGPATRAGQKAPLKVSLAVGAASAIAIALLTVIIVGLVWRRSRIEVTALSGGTPPGVQGGRGGRGERGGHDPHGVLWYERVVDLGDIVPLIVLLGLLSVLVVSLIAWWATRRANQPIERALEIQRAFVADASHELRTPLTTLNSRIQLAEHRLERGGDVQEALGQARADAGAMDDVLTDLLTAAEAAGGAGGGQPTSVLQSASAAIQQVGLQAADADVTIKTAIPADAWVLAEDVALKRALIALLDNATRHSPAGSTITVAAQTAPRSKFVNILVSDHGPGIMEADPNRLFERFARVSEGGKRRGFGLGLALVRDIAGRFGGDVYISQTGPGGTTFCLQLPKA